MGFALWLWIPALSREALGIRHFLYRIKDGVWIPDALFHVTQLENTA